MNLELQMMDDLGWFDGQRHHPSLLWKSEVGIMYQIIELIWNVLQSAGICYEHLTSYVRAFCSAFGVIIYLANNLCTMPGTSQSS